MPKVSVIIPVHNGRAYLQSCISSITAQDVPCEIIIIDDASNDGIYDDVQTLEAELKNKPDTELIYLRNETSLGAAETRNKGILTAKCEYIAFLDIDDTWEEGKLKRQIEMLDSGLQFTYTGRRNISKNGEKIITCQERVSYDEILRYNPITTSSVVMEAGLAKSHLMSHSELCEDYLTWIQILSDIPYAYGINEPLVRYMIHEGSESNNKFKHALRRYKTYKAAGIGFFKRVFYSIYYIIIALLKRA